MKGKKLIKNALLILFLAIRPGCPRVCSPSSSSIRLRQEGWSASAAQIPQRPHIHIQRLRLADDDAGKVRMTPVEQVVAFGGHDCARYRQNCAGPFLQRGAVDCDSAVQMTARPLGFQRPPYCRAPSRENAEAAKRAMVMRHTVRIRQTRRARCDPGCRTRSVGADVGVQQRQGRHLAQRRVFGLEPGECGVGGAHAQTTLINGRRSGRTRRRRRSASFARPASRRGPQS